MTANRRIFLNIVATYGRSLFALVCGLFSARWVLMALGQQDFGLYGVVGGLTFFIAMLNGLMAGATARFYAFSIGAASKDGDKDGGLEECREWFNTALMVHTIVPLVCVVIGYPCGLYFVQHVLNIPADRMCACIWVYRFAVLTCLVAMVNVPFQAMYVAKQYIAELTIYSFAQTTLNFFFFWYMVSHPSVWLVKYALWMCSINVIPQLLICFRALKVFPECRFNYGYWWQWMRVRQMWSYAGWNAFAGLGALFRNQGVAVLINRSFGSVVNAAMSIANQVSSQAQNLTAAMQGAFSPAITQKCGAGDLGGMRRMAFQACKFGTMLVLIFAIPLFVELPEVIRLWLKTPPPYAVGLCRCMLILLVLDKITIGHMIAVNANGKVAAYQAYGGTMLMLAFPFAWLFVKCSFGIYSIGIALILSQALSSAGRVWFARRLVGMSGWEWIKSVFVPIAITLLAASACAFAPQAIMNQSFTRIIATTTLTEIILLPMGWVLVLDKEEKSFLINHISRKMRRRF